MQITQWVLRINAPDPLTSDKIVQVIRYVNKLGLKYNVQSRLVEITEVDVVHPSIKNIKND